MTNPNLSLVALCIWREARSEGASGMAAVGCVISNRAARHHQTIEQAVMVPWAFSSMTAPNDPQLGVYPKAGDVEFKTCCDVEAGIRAATLADPTQGATLYYDDSITFPKSWNPAHVEATVKIGRLNFFREV